jgi:hypothetical protein
MAHNLVTPMAQLYVNNSHPALQVTESLAAQQTHNQTNTHTHKARKQEDPKTHNSIIYKQISILFVLCWFSSLQLILSICVCVCVCVCVSLSLSIYIYITLAGLWRWEWGIEKSSTKSRQRIVLKRFNNITSQVLTDSKLQFL